jgi:excinuclease ABC subunit C
MGLIFFVVSDPRMLARLLPLDPGVYRFRAADGRALYVGRARHLRRRVQSYWTHLGDRPHLARMVRAIATIEAVSCDSEHEAAWLERNLLQQSRPRWNRVEGGAEVAGYIRFDAGPRRPGLRFTHTVTASAPHFGPYLGGLRIRQAISALHRALPLTYAGDVDGSAREFADLLGVRPGDRDALAQTTIAVLQRDPPTVTAIRADLVRRRDRAAEDLRFEFAAKLREEITAFDWIVAEQKVTSQHPADLEVHGWHDGIQVRFEIREGRVRTWTLRPAKEATARTRVAATPPPWQSFAQRNAELAARLSTAG